MTARSNAAHKTFWQEFSKRSPAWAQQLEVDDTQGIVESIDSLLQAHGIDLCFDVTSHEEDCHLIFSPEGDREEAVVIDALVDAAPAIPGWRLSRRRQRKEIEDAAAIARNLYVLDPLDLKFEVHRSPSETAVRMFVPAEADLLPGEAQGMVDTFLWHALGEELVMQLALRGEVVFNDSPPATAMSAKELQAAFAEKS